ncbi:MAG: DNA polymerase IV [Chloroflexi bacterium]|nr:DNA polymerase IV [Anaerolineaceae bacterium]NMB89291.1 DNA polymerase IV [Chloroflexota bacterium]
MAPRKIIHLDLDAFFCAVEELRQPDLAGKPFAVGGQPNERGVVASCSYAARQSGVHSAMPMAQAVRVCPGLIIVSSQYSAYQHASERVMEILQDLTPRIEQISIDEAFLDVSDLPESHTDIARALQGRIASDLQLPCSLGLASNKLVAKIATDVGKANHRQASYPRAITYVAPGTEAEFLAPLAARMLWGVGPKTAERLAGLGAQTIGDIVALGQDTLVRQFGRPGGDLWRHAQGLDERPVESDHVLKSISQETTFERDRRDEKQLLEVLQELSEQVGYRLRQQQLVAGTVRIKLRWSDFSTFTRQMTLPTPTDQDGVLADCAFHLFYQLWQPGRAVRLLGVGASNLGSRVHQLSLWDTPVDKERKLLQAIDELRERYGKKVVQRGRGIKPQSSA